MMQSIWTAHQIQGGRDYQEDRFAVVENSAIFYNGKRYPFERGVFPQHQSLYVLADGMGGMGNGELAAETVVETFVEAFLNLANVAIPSHEKLNSSLFTANNAIKSLVEITPSYDGMGCTLIAVLYDSRTESLHWVSVGDSLLWLLRDGALQQLNEKHTWGELAKKMKAAGESFDEPKYAELSHVLCSAMDGHNVDHVDLPKGPFLLANGDLLLLASDGVESLSISRLEALLLPASEKIKNAPQLKDAFEDLCDGRRRVVSAIETVDRPHQDNATLMACAFLQGEEEVLK